MRHSFLDKYAYQDTAVHRLDGRVKLIVLVALNVAVVTTSLSAWWALAGYLMLVGAVVAVGRIPPLYVLSRGLVIMPFVALAAASAPFLDGGRVLWSTSLFGLSLQVSEHGARTAAAVIARSMICVAALITFMSITPMAQVLDSLRRLRAPAVLVMLIGFAYRYVFVLVDEAQRLKVARDSRSFGGKTLWHLRVLGRMIGTLLIRSCERAERVYAAMLSRGYDSNGTPPVNRPLPLKRTDVGFLAGSLATLLTLRTSAIWLPRML